LQALSRLISGAGGGDIQDMSPPGELFGEKLIWGETGPFSSALEHYFPEKDDLRPVYGGLILG
jgi:hypothetical protein